MNEKKIKIVHISMIVLGIIYLASGAFHSGIWFDESYTVGLMQLNIIDLCKAATFDVHPLMYYLLLKLYSFVFGNGIIALRLFSVVGASLLALLGYTHIRRDFGAKTGFWFSFLVMFMPSTFKYALQIRMYTWAPLFVALTAIYIYRMIYKEEDKKKNTALFVTFSIMAAYTHYFALMAVAVMNILLLIYYNKNKISLKKWYKMAAVQIGVYLPGLLVFILQITNGGGSWIKIKLETFLDTISFHFMGVPMADVNTSSARYAITMALSVLLYVSFGILFVQMRKKNKEESKPVTLALIVYFGVIFVCLIVSIFRPVYYVRYSIVSYGLLIFTFAFLLVKYNKTYIKVIVAVVMIGLSIMGAVPIYQESYDASNTVIDDYLEANMQEGDIFLFDSAGAFVVSVKYQNTPTYFYNFWNWSVQRAYKAFGENVKIIGNLDELKNYKGRIWIINKEHSYDAVKSWTGVKEISCEHLQIPYYHKENAYDLILIEKK